VRSEGRKKRDLRRVNADSLFDTFKTDLSYKVKKSMVYLVKSSNTVGLMRPNNSALTNSFN
jgi:hypothetical protein